MRVLSHHLHALPTAQLLQYVQRRSRLHMPACPSMPEVVPSKVLDTHPHQGCSPCPCIDLGHRFSLIAEHMRWMLADLLTYHDHSRRTQRNRNCFSGLGLIRVNPCCPPDRALTRKREECRAVPGFAQHSECGLAVLPGQPVPVPPSDVQLLCQFSRRYRRPQETPER